jgi:SAM-dependent methyltransferase
MIPIWLISRKAHLGTCPICEGSTVFIKYHSWLRDNYRCLRCWSIPRQRAIVHVLGTHFPEISKFKVHESSPGGVSSEWVERHAADYVPTHFYADTDNGSYKGKFRCENLESMTFGNNEFDLTVTQDVMEHVLDPASAFSEIARTLKPGGAHVFTVPIYSRSTTLIRAEHSSSGVNYLESPEYHGNPIDEKGSLVAREWGDDIVEFIEQHTGMPTTRHTFSDHNMGLQAEHLDVLVSRKPMEPRLHDE